jgi:hypothetical protein
MSVTIILTLIPPMHLASQLCHQKNMTCEWLCRKRDFGIEWVKYGTRQRVTQIGYHTESFITHGKSFSNKAYKVEFDDACNS